MTTDTTHNPTERRAADPADNQPGQTQATGDTPMRPVTATTNPNHQRAADRADSTSPDVHPSERTPPMVTARNPHGQRTAHAADSAACPIRLTKGRAMTASLTSLPPMMTADGLFVPDVLLTLRQASNLCGCTMQTLRRRLSTGRLPHAVKDGRTGTEQWFVPLGDLVIAGLLPADHVAEPGASPDLTAHQQGHLQHLVEENQRLSATVRELRRDVAFLQPLLAGRGAA